jgi:hypothetical protein
MEEDDVIVRRYIDKDYADIIEAGYPFDSCLRPNLYNRMKNLISRKEIEKIVLKTFLLNQEEIILVAYSKKDRKAVGVITLRKITDNLYAIWDIFVSPLSRGKRIAHYFVRSPLSYRKKEKSKKLLEWYLWIMLLL